MQRGPPQVMRRGPPDQNGERMTTLGWQQGAVKAMKSCLVIVLPSTMAAFTTTRCQIHAGAVRGDNAAAIGFLNHESYVKAGDVRSTLGEAWDHASQQLTAALFEYIPREINKVADALAVEARIIAKSYIGCLPADLPSPEIYRMSTTPETYPTVEVPVSDGNRVVLKECPFISADDMQLLNFTNCDAHAELLPSYLFQAHDPGSAEVPVQYLPKTLNGQGRHYSTPHAIQSRSKTARIVALQKHDENDIVAAHLASHLCRLNKKVGATD
jgi:hypothetical protein